MGKRVLSMKLMEQCVAVTFLKGDASVHAKRRQSVLVSGYNDPSALGVLWEYPRMGTEIHQQNRSLGCSL